jgi:shikimate kinase
MPNNRKIYIVGFMGSGKTTAGRKLATLLGWSFLDLDRKIEQKSGMKIAELFSSQGEEYFRKEETEALRNTEAENNTVISTGGGTPCHDDNMEFMLANGLTIYLKLKPVQLQSRLSKSTWKRPLIKDMSGEALLEFIKEKLAIREFWYEKADIVIDAFPLDLRILCSIVRSKLKI